MPTALQPRYKLCTILLSAIILALISGVSGVAQQPQSINLTILHTNDIHGHLFPFDYNQPGNEATDVGGAARRVALIRQLKASAKGAVIVMDAGDAFTRGPLSNLMGVPDFEIMNAVPYDIMTIGNNEFKGASGLEGQNVLFARIKQAKFPIVSSNVVDKATGKTIVPPYEILNLNGIRVGIFGLLTGRVSEYDQAKGLEIKNPIEVAKLVVAELKQKTDFIIALTHVGYPQDLELALAAPGIDVIIGGDSHTWLPQPTFVPTGKAEDGDIGGVVVCQDGEWGKCVGKLDLSLRQGRDHRYNIASYTGKLVEVNSSTKPAADIEKIIARYAAPYMRTLGRLPATVPLAEAPKWVAERMREAVKADVGVEPADGIENGLKAGTVTQLDVRKMFPFNNNVSKLTITGRQLRELLQSMNAGLAGAQMRQGVLYIGESKAEDDKTYTLAIEDFYAATQPAIKGVKSEECSFTSRDVVEKYLGAISKDK